LKHSIRMLVSQHSNSNVSRENYGPLQSVEKIILSQKTPIEAWFRQQWQMTRAPITSSVDLRPAGFKLSPVDTNLFPAGFNNLNRDCLALAVQAAQSVIGAQQCLKILLIPESHTRNKFYFQSLAVLREILVKAGFYVRIGTLDSDIAQPFEMSVEGNCPLTVEPLQRSGSRLQLEDFDPCMVLLNNDLSEGIPPILAGVEQPVYPHPHLGWSNRLKSQHFYQFSQVAQDFADFVNMDSWLINPLYQAVEGVDFMGQEGTEAVASAVDQLIAAINNKYQEYEIKEKPFVAIKADNGTYGMSVMMASSGEEILSLNRKQRTKMAASKGGRKVNKVIIQEGVFTTETMADGSVAEPVIYMIGPYVVGGFYRVHHSRGFAENLNSPGMHFEPLAFSHPCNLPSDDLNVEDSPNRFYTYSVIARLAALAAAREVDGLAIK
jgi:glutamate--cysteine ligase